MHIVMVAAENGTLPGAKVGGIGDVIRDVPHALAIRGHQVTVITPGYQSLSELPGATLQQVFTVNFATSLETLELYLIDTPAEPPQVRHMLLEHPLFAACGAGQIYCHDPVEPFATDASKFALFCLAVCHALTTGAIEKADVLHLHDWHAAMVLLLRESHPSYRALQSIPAAYTIHNLSLQGIRPFGNNWSSPAQWFPTLQYAASRVADPQVAHCINLMRTGINLADKVHAVSPTYAAEILLPSEPGHGLIRGEGLEADMQAINSAGKLFGILNGCEYSQSKKVEKKPLKAQMIKAVSSTLDQWTANKTMVPASYFYALKRLAEWEARKSKDECVVAFVGRLTAQKVSLLQVAAGPETWSIDDLLGKLDKGYMIMLGSGDSGCERFMLDAMKRHPNFMFLCGYSEALAELVYRFCDLFLMPSTFEPCGISQMLAMRAGTPCLVHRVGGLADTVQHGVNGFAFEGENPAEQVQQMLAALTDILELKSSNQPLWQTISRNAAAARFSWDATVTEYENKLYTPVLA